MAYNIVFQTTTQGSESVTDLRAKVLLMQQRYQTAAAEVRRSVKAIADATKEAAAAAAEGDLLRAQSQQAAADKERRALNDLIQAERQAKAELDALTSSTQKFSASTLEARAAVQALNGNFGTMAAGRWLASIKELGPLMSGIFAIAGPIAFGEVLLHLAERFDPLAKAEKALAEGTKQIDDEVKKLSEDVQRFDLDKFTQIFGPVAGSAMGAARMERQITADRVTLQARNDQLAERQKYLAEISSNSVEGDLLAPGRIEAAEDDVELLRRQRDEAALQLERDQKAQAGAMGKVGQGLMDQDKDRDNTKTTEANRASEKAAEQAKHAAGVRVDLQKQLNDAQSKEVSTAAQIDAKRDDELAKLNEQHRLGELNSQQLKENLALVIQIWSAERVNAYMNAVKTAQANAREMSSKVVEDIGRASHFDDEQFARDLRKTIEGETKQVNTGNRIISSWNDADADGVQRATQEKVQRNRSMVAGGQISPSEASAADLQARLSAAQSILEIKTKDLDVDKLDSALRDTIAGRQVELTNQEMSDLDRLAAARKQYAEEIYQAESQYEEELNQQREEDLEKFKSLAGSAFEALASRRPGALANLFREEVISLGKTITENLAGLAEPTIEKLTPSAKSGTLFGKLLQNTPFQPRDNPKDNPLTKPALDLDNSATKLSQAATDLSAAARSGAGGNAVPTVPGGGVPGTGNIGYDGLPVGSAAAVGGATNALNIGGIVNGSDVFGEDGLPIGGGGATNAINLGGVNNTVTGGSGFGFNTSTVAEIGGAAAGAYRAYKGFSEGGVGGDLSGVSGVLGTGASIAAMIPGGQAVAAGMAIASAVTGLIGSFLNGPQRRANQISEELGSNQYIAPTALQVTQDSSGGFTTIGTRGNLETTDFSPYPQVREGSIWTQTHGMFDGPPTYYDVPGGQTSQFGAAMTQPQTVVHNHYWTVNAMDSQSFSEYAQSNHMALGEAMATHLQDVPGRFADEVRKTAKS